MPPYDKVVVTVGGSSREKLERLLPEGVAVTACVPSLFTLKIPDKGLRALMGTVVEPVTCHPTPPAIWRKTATAAPC